MGVDKAHECRNLAEYEGCPEQDERLLKGMLTAVREPLPVTDAPSGIENVGLAGEAPARRGMR